MGTLIFTASMSIDGYVADADGAYRLDPVAVAAPGADFRVVAADAAGNTRETTLAVASSAADTRGPTVQFRLLRDTGRDPDDRVTSMPTVVAVVDDASPLAQLTASFNGFPAVDVMPWLNGASLILSADRLATLGDGTLADGTHTLQFEAEDALGHRSPAASFTFTLDRTRPGQPAALDLPAEFDTGSSSVDNVTRLTSIELQTSAEPGTFVRLYLDGQLLDELPGAASISFPVGPLADGQHAFTAVAEDLAGNYSPFTFPLTVTVDATAPAAPTVALAPLFRDDSGAADVTIFDTVELQGTAEPGTLVRLVGTENAATVGSDGSYALSDVRLQQGANELTVTSTDLAGNLATTVQTIHMDDRIGPTIQARLLNDTGVSLAAPKSLTWNVISSASIPAWFRPSWQVAPFSAAGGLNKPSRPPRRRSRN